MPIILILLLLNPVGLLDSKPVDYSLEEKITSFEEAYNTLKKSEKWEEIITLGHQAVATELDPGKKAHVENILSSCYFYLGDYEFALENAKAALGHAQASGSLEQKARSAYLISAAYRALKNEAEASQYIRLALALCESPIADFTKAKIHFNAGALAQDLAQDSAAATQYYQMAKQYFADKTGDDYVRTEIRHIRCLLESGNPAAAQIAADVLQVESQSKTRVHLLQLQSKIAIAHGQYEIADQYLTLALELATHKHMSADVHRLKELKHSIQFPRPYPTSDS